MWPWGIEPQWQTNFFTLLPLSYHSIYNKILDIVEEARQIVEQNSFKVHHVYREGNQLADVIANSTYSKSEREIKSYLLTKEEIGKSRGLYIQSTSSIVIERNIESSIFGSTTSNGVSSRNQNILNQDKGEIKNINEEEDKEE
ncbi:hypothetical protein H5410_044494 [Solanum commersonii]|uniref:Uncharacterized protein n=1 Tax=Solanum commersonii TaxID=4109 RepID=A0A9J5XA18_SOLCO|nr:hypothetical protein H5410_044494 [Solanum commersonii]